MSGLLVRGGQSLQDLEIPQIKSLMLLYHMQHDCGLRNYKEKNNLSAFLVSWLF